MRRRATMERTPHLWCVVPGGPGEAPAGFLLPVRLGEPLAEDAEDGEADVAAILCSQAGSSEVEIPAPLGAILDQDLQPYDVAGWIGTWADEAEAVPIRSARR